MRDVYRKVIKLLLLKSVIDVGHFVWAATTILLNLCLCITMTIVLIWSSTSSMSVTLISGRVNKCFTRSQKWFCVISTIHLRKRSIMGDYVEWLCSGLSLFRV
jgi:hypothetical protein